MTGADPSPDDRPPADRAPRVRPFLGGELGDDPRLSDLPGATAPRPFLLTAGRTPGASSVALEAQVVATPEGRRAHDGLTFEYRDIVGICVEPLAVAEVAARLRLHVGVVQVLVGDLTHHGMVTTYEPSEDITDDVDTILRVIHELRQRTS
jgi:hypothetical protein